MKYDAIAWAKGGPVGKVISKETLNHRELIELVSGLDVYRDTSEAYRRAYEALGIDLINRVPLENAPAPTPPGETTNHPSKPYSYQALGVYDTVVCNAFTCSTVEDVWTMDVEALQYEDLINGVPHSCKAADIVSRESAIGEVGLYYSQLYTTAFMWGVEALGWEIFMMAAALEPERFHEHFIVPCVAKAKRIVTEMARASDSPLVFVHDDLVLLFVNSMTYIFVVQAACAMGTAFGGSFDISSARSCLVNFHSNGFAISS